MARSSSAGKHHTPDNVESASLCCPAAVNLVNHKRSVRLDYGYTVFPLIQCTVVNVYVHETTVLGRTHPTPS